MNSCKILVVEDDPSIRRVIMVALKRDGYTNIEEVTDGNEAVDMAFRFRPDLVLLDIMLPGMNGKRPTQTAGECELGDFSKLACQAGPLFTAVREDDADGSYRGFYAQVQYTIHPDKLFGADILKGGKQSFQIECFDKGNYFRDNNDHTALFGRIELAWEF